MSPSAFHREEIIRRRQLGEWPTDIARALGVSRNTVIGVCFRAGLADKEAGKCMVPRGESSGAAKLTASDVRAIRAEYIPWRRGFGYKALAKRYGVAQSTIERVVSGETWGHLRGGAANA